jgi:dihydrodipicolinate synthase/N-acetylneuraminate lyase
LSEIPGIIVPLVAAFTDDTSTLSEVRVARMVRFHMDRGARGFMVNADAGDPFQLAHSERKQLLEWVIRDADGLPVWVNISATTTAGAVDLCQHASRHGAKGAVVCPPPVGRFAAHEAKGMLMAVSRHGNLQAVFADPEGKWEGFESPLSPIAPVDPSWCVLPRPTPDEAMIGPLMATPFAMFGADKAPVVATKLDVLRAAMQAVIAHGGLGRATRYAMTELGCDVGNSRPPAFELVDEGKKILAGMLKVIGAVS